MPIVKAGEKVQLLVSAITRNHGRTVVPRDRQNVGSTRQQIDNANKALDALFRYSALGEDVEEEMTIWSDVIAAVEIGIKSQQEGNTLFSFDGVRFSFIFSAKTERQVERDLLAIVKEYVITDPDYEITSEIQEIRQAAEMIKALELEDKTKDVHTEHCCARHGCKYGKEDCPVELKIKNQSFACEACSDSYVKHDWQED